MAMTGKPVRRGEVVEAGVAGPSSPSSPDDLRQGTAAGDSPARRVEVDSSLRMAGLGVKDAARGAARNGNTCPGRLKSFACALGSTSARMVAARSAAEMPVVVPWR